MQAQFEAERDSADDLYPTNDLWQQYRGRKALMKAIIGYENFIRAQLEMLDNPSVEDNPDADCL
jgi:hypothetical protein